MVSYQREAPVARSTEMGKPEPRTVRASNDNRLSRFFLLTNGLSRESDSPLISMKEQDVNLWIMTNKEALPEGKLPYIRAKLLEMSEDKWAEISMVEFKSPMTLLMVSFFLGGFGVDRFMLGQTGAGIGKLLTGGGCTIWWFIDLFNISKLTKEYNWRKLAMWI